MYEIWMKADAVPLRTLVSMFEPHERPVLTYFEGEPAVHIVANDHDRFYQLEELVRTHDLPEVNSIGMFMQQTIRRDPHALQTFGKSASS